MYASIETEEYLQELVLSSIKNDVQDNEKNIENDEQLNKLQKLNVTIITDDTDESKKIGTDEKIQQSANANIDLGKAESLRLCAVCKNETSGAHKCLDCHEYVHVICGESYENEGFGANVTCKLFSERIA